MLTSETAAPKLRREYLVLLLKKTQQELKQIRQNVNPFFKSSRYVYGYLFIIYMCILLCTLLF